MPTSYQLCIMCVCMIITYNNRVWIHRVSKVVNPARGQLNREENEYSPVPVIVGVGKRRRTLVGPW